MEENICKLISWQRIKMQNVSATEIKKKKKNPVDKWAKDLNRSQKKKCSQEIDEKNS